MEGSRALLLLLACILTSEKQMNCLLLHPSPRMGTPVLLGAGLRSGVILLHNREKKWLSPINNRQIPLLIVQHAHRGTIVGSDGCYCIEQAMLANPSYEEPEISAVPIAAGSGSSLT